MDNTTPLVSVCATCYNHEKYIPFFMESLMKQEFQDWELVVTDDYSTDNSYEVLMRYTCDPRVRVFRNEKNRHVGHTTNNSLARARGKYICIISVDDGFVKGKLEHDYNYLEAHKNISVLYSNLILIGEDDSLSGEMVSHPVGLDRYKCLNFMYTHANRMLIPGLFFRRQCLDEIGYINPLLCITQDYEFHIRLMLKYDIAISEQSLVYYRRRDDNQNLSAITPHVLSCVENEMAMMLESCVRRIKDIEQFRCIFPDFNRYGCLVSDDIIFYAGLILVEGKSAAIRMTGLKLLYEFMQSDVAYVEKKYGFTAKDMITITQSVDCFCEYMYMHDNSKIRSWVDKVICSLWKSMTRKLRRRGIIRKF